MQQFREFVKKYWSIILGSIILIVSIILYFNLEEKWISFISFVIGVLGIVIPLWQSRQDNNFKEEYGVLIDDYKKKYDSELNKNKELTNEKEKESFEKSELKKFLFKINETLQKENISKEELMKNMSHSLKAILFFKTAEDTSNKRMIFINKIYPELGVIGIRSGLSLLPPSRVPQDKTNEQIIEWFKSEIDKRIPKDYEYNIPLITVINLNETKSFKQLKDFRKIQLSFLDKIPIEELLTTKEVLNYLLHKKNLSSKDIIEMPNLVFLIEDYLIGKVDLESIRENNEKILDEIKKKIGIKEIKTTDMATVDKIILTDALKTYVSDPEKVYERIKENSTFWKSYFENRLNIKE